MYNYYSPMQLADIVLYLINRVTVDLTNELRGSNPPIDNEQRNC